MKRTLVCNPTRSDPREWATFPVRAAARLPLRPDSIISHKALRREGPCQKVQLLLSHYDVKNLIINLILEILIYLGLVLRELAFLLSICFIWIKL